MYSFCFSKTPIYSEGLSLFCITREMLLKHTGLQYNTFRGIPVRFGLRSEYFKPKKFVLMEINFCRYLVL